MGTSLRYSVRMLLKSPGVTAAAILSLALGIGANATIFTWVKSVLINPLPGIAEAERLFVIAPTARDGRQRSLSYPNVRDIRALATTFDLIGQDDVSLSVNDGQHAERAWGMLVTSGYFDIIGVDALRGRTFLPEEEQTPEGGPVLVLSHRYWQRRFGGDPHAIGRQVTVNGHPYTIIGVTPPEFLGTSLGLAPELWVPMMQQPQLMPDGSRFESRGHNWMQGMVRLRPGASIEQARAELETIRARLEGVHPANEGWRLALVPTWQSPWGAPSALAPVLLVLAGVVGILLVIACANVANLLLSKAVGRRREIAVRLSLGASRGHIVRQLLAESMLLAALGGVAAVVVAYWSAGLLMSFVPPVDVPINLGLRVDGSVLAFTLGVSLLTGLVFGLAPAMHASGHGLTQALREESGRTSAAGLRSRLRNGLVVAQVALCLILLVGAGLFLQSLRRAQALAPGFDPDNVLVAMLDVFPLGYDEPRAQAFQSRLVERLEAIPNVTAAALARSIPLGFYGTSSSGIDIEGYQPQENEELNFLHNEISPEYFRTLRIPIVRGRGFTGGDDAAAPPVVIINETMAARYWKGEDAVGRFIGLGGTRVQIVGVARDGKYTSLSETPTGYMYFPLAQRFRSGVFLHLRTDGDPVAFTPALRQAIRELDPNLPLGSVQTMHESLESAVFAQRIGATLLSIFGVLALTLAAVGLYSVMSYAVSQRMHEMGIRLALGATPGELRRMVIASSLRITGLGLLIGAAGAVAATRLLTGLLHGVSPTDPLTFGLVIATLTGIALMAAFLPARRAGGVDPIVALRYE